MKTKKPHKNGDFMERKESRNGLELIKFGAIRLKGNFSALFMGALAMVTPLVLAFLVPYLIARFTGISWIISIGVVLFAIMVGPLQMGYIKYFNATIDGKQPSLSMVYSQFKFSIFTLRTIYIALLLLVLYIVGGILWIVPAGFAVAFFSMVLFFLEKYKYNRLSEALTDCARQMIGNRLAMFSYKLILYFVYLLIFGVGALCLTLVFLLAEDSMLVSYIVALCSVIVFIFLYTMLTVYYHSCNQIFFEDTLMYNERKRNKKLAESKVTTPVETNNDKKPSENVTSIEKKKEVTNTQKEEGKEYKAEEKTEDTIVKTAKQEVKKRTKKATKSEPKKTSSSKTSSNKKTPTKKTSSKKATSKKPSASSRK